VISQRARQAMYLFGLADAMLLVLALFLAYGVRSLAPIPMLQDGLAIDLPTHIWLLTVGIPAY
jgi:hypothetical protein